MFDHGLDSPNKTSSHLQHSNLHLPNMDLYLLLELLLLLHILLLLRVHGPVTEEEEQEEEEEEEKEEEDGGGRGRNGRRGWLL